MNHIRLAANISVWVSASLLAVLPALIGFDFGGVLWWTQYMAASIIVFAAMLALPTLINHDAVPLLRRYWFVVILLGWCSYAWLQTVPMFAGLVSVLSNGSKVAYRDWIKPFMGPEGPPTFFPISVDPEQTVHAVAWMAIMACAVWTATQVFVSRSKISMLLHVVAIGAALHAIVGIIRLVYPFIPVMGLEMPTTSFGTFVNRNNAALFLNTGLAASLGLLTWRLAALTGIEVDDKNFEFNDLLSLVNDRESLVGLTTAFLNLAGLVVCGSRGGMVGLVVGFILAIGYVRQRRGLKTVPVVGSAIALAIVFMVLSLNLPMLSITRFNPLASSPTLLEDGRLDHWPTSFATAKAHFPAGSGLASYAFAYLPYQDPESASDQWFVHADNLWLELLVEQGIVGLVMAGAILFILIRTLLRMVRSADPIDHGLRVCGWYAVGAVVASQIFDYGLIVPTNTLALAALAAALMSRATAAGLNVAHGESHVFPSKYATYWCAGLAALVLLSAIGARGRLNGDARVDAVIKRVNMTLPTVQGDVEALDELAQQIRDAPRSQSSPRLLNQLSKVQHAQARLMDAAAADPRTAEEATNAYQQTSVMALRENWYARSAADPDNGPPPAITSEPAAELYQAILDNSRESLLRLPLGMEARTWQLYFDFVHGDPARAEQAITQLAQIYTGNPLMLERLGLHAAAAGDTERASSLWYRALELDPQRTGRVLNRVLERDDIPLLDVMPPNHTVFRFVTRWMVDRGRANEELLHLAENEIKCGQAETKKEKADCLRLAADIAYELGDLDESFQRLRAAIELTPLDARLHMIYIERLRASDRNTEARTAAQRGRLLFPNDPRFEHVIRELANEALREIEELPDDSLIRQDEP